MKKRILFLINNLGHGGAEHVLVNMANNLNKNDYDVTIQTIFDTGVNRKYINKDVKYIPGMKKQLRGNVMILRCFSPKFLYNFFVKEKYDIIVGYLEGISTRIISGCPDKKTKKVSWIHIEPENRQQFEYAYGSTNKLEQAYNCMDKIICVSNNIKNKFTNLWNIKVPVQVLYNINESDEIIRLSTEAQDELIEKEGINIVSVGRLVEQKGYDRLINVHKRLLENGIKNNIYIIGSGRLRDCLEKQIEDQNLQNTFKLIGFKENPYKYVSKADLFVCSSRSEGFSTAVTEALILGIPIVSTNVSGASELLEDNKYGIITPNTEEGLYRGLEQMICIPENLDHYKNQAIQRGKNFDKQTTVKAIENMFNTL